MTTITDKLAEALELAREWFRHEDPNIGPRAFEVVEAADAALAAYASQQEEPEDAQFKPAMDSWLLAVGNLTHALGSGVVIATTPTESVSEIINQAAEKLRAATPPAPEAQSLLNGLTEAETAQTASVAGLVNREPSDARVEAAVVCCGDWATCRQPCVPRANHWQASAVPDGFVLVREKATPLIREALRIGMRREVPNDELCDIRWRAAIAAAAPGSEQKEGAR